MKDKCFHLLKPRGSKHALPSRPSKPDLSYALPETVLEPIILELPLPLGVGLDKTNVVAEINEFGSAISSNVRLEDRLIHVDGREVRAGRMQVVDAFDLSCSAHTIVLQRAVSPPPPVRFLTVRLHPRNGMLGIGTTRQNVLSEIVRGSAADLDGRLQVPLHHPPSPLPLTLARPLPYPSTPHLHALLPPCSLALSYAASLPTPFPLSPSSHPLSLSNLLMLPTLPYYCPLFSLLLQFT